MTHRQITIEDIMGLSPCDDCPLERVEQLFDGLPFVTVEQIASCGICLADKVWVLVHLLRERTYVVKFADMCAERAHGYANSTNAAHARYAAQAAAEAARYAAHYALYAARYAGHASDYARYASDYAAHAAASDYGSATERELQLTHLLELHAAEENPTKR